MGQFTEFQKTSNIFSAAIKGTAKSVSGTRNALRGLNSKNNKRILNSITDTLSDADLAAIQRQQAKNIANSVEKPILGRGTRRELNRLGVQPSAVNQYSPDDVMSVLSDPRLYGRSARRNYSKLTGKMNKLKAGTGLSDANIDNYKNVVLDAQQNTKQTLLGRAGQFTGDNLLGLGAVTAGGAAAGTALAVPESREAIIGAFRGNPSGFQGAMQDLDKMLKPLGGMQTALTVLGGGAILTLLYQLFMKRNR